MCAFLIGIAFDCIQLDLKIIYLLVYNCIIIDHSKIGQNSQKFYHLYVEFGIIIRNGI